MPSANNYQNEESEQWLGEWMEKRGNRDQMVIATKACKLIFKQLGYSDVAVF